MEAGGDAGCPSASPWKPSMAGVLCLELRGAKSQEPLGGRLGPTLILQLMVLLRSRLVPGLSWVLRAQR